MRANLTPETEREFFASGESLVEWLFHEIEERVSPQFAPISTLEYGCGAGRLALPLARRPGGVTAVDSSAEMLEFARAEAVKAGLGHIAFETPEALFAKPRKFDLVVCYHVLQRMAPADGLVLLEKLIGLIAPNGVGMFQWPFLTTESGLTGATRWLREHVPGANEAANRLRGKSADVPFIPTHRYEFSEVLPVFDRAGFRSLDIVFDHQQDLGYAIAFARRPELGREAAARYGSKQSPRAVIGDAVPSSASREPAPQLADIDTYNRAAEMYYASLKSWEHHLAKPFSQIEETPAILMNVAVLLQALDLARGLRVLEFGAGTGWLARFLTQLGCQVTLLDVSPTALAIAQEHFHRQPVSGDQPAPAFVVFDGRRIDVPDESFDRVICFDAFHHAPNPDDVIREFARVLAPAGRAAFAEPGPRHSESSRSEFESHTYGVVESDVDVHAIWRVAKTAGFDDIRMCVFHEPPYHVSLDEFEDLVAGGAAQERWLASTRGFLHHVRDFVLVKAGTAPADSRRAKGLACEIVPEADRIQVSAGQPFSLVVTVTNSGSSLWLPPDAPIGGVTLGAHLYDERGGLIRFEAARAKLTDPPQAVQPGERLTVRLELPPLEPGRYRLELDCVADRVTWFAQGGSATATIAVDCGN